MLGISFMKYTLTLVFLCVAAAPDFAQDIALSAILLPNEAWHPVADGVQDVQGMTADRSGNVYVSTKAGKGLLFVSTSGRTSAVFDTETGFAGLAYGADGRVYACQPEKRRLVAL